MPSALETSLAVQALIAVWIGVRSFGSYRGRRYSTGRILIFPALVLLIYVATEFETIVAVPWAFPLWTGIDAAVLVASALVTVPFADRLVRVSQRDDGGWYYQYGAELIGLYLALWVVRLGLAAYFDPGSIEFAAPTGAPLSATASDVLILIQGLFSLSSGLVLGRAIGTYRLHRAAEERLRSPVADAK